MNTRTSHDNPGTGGARQWEPLIHVWCPDIYGPKGGIGAFCTSLLDALHNWNPSAMQRIFLKNDAPRHRPPADRDGQTRYHFSGQWPAKLRTGAYSAKLLGFGIADRPDLIIVGHIHFAAAANLLRRFTGIPYWTMAYGVEAWGIERPELRAALRNSDHIFSISQHTRERLLREQSLDHNKVSLLACTFDEERFAIGPKPSRLLDRHNLKPEQPVILTVSRLVASEQYKGYDRVLRTMPQLREAIPGVRYVIVGKGDDRPRIEHLIQELGVEDCVTLAGFIPDEELCDYYNLCDVFAMPSKREGFGIVFLEAMACGKPTLGGNKDGAVDALQQGRLGALIDPDDISQLAEALISIIRKTYPHDLMYRPKALREAVVDAFGFDRFKHTLSTYLEEFFATTEPGRQPAAGLKGGKAA